MKGLFVNHIQALALKEIGFQEPCIARFIGSQFSTNTLANWYNHNGGEISNKMISAPLKYQVFEWFISNHNLQGFVKYIPHSEKWCWYVCTVLDWEHIEYETKECFQLYKKREEAESDCIDKLIELIKK